LTGYRPAQIKALLLLHGISQTEIAEAIDCHIQHVSDVINGRRSTKRIRDAIAAAVERDTTELWPDERFRRPSGRIVRRAGFTL